MSESAAGARVPEGLAANSWRANWELVLPPILDAALEDFQAQGYHGTSVRTIAANVGVTMPSLYYHYGNKEGILFALLDVAMDDLLARVEGGLAEAGDDTHRRFENYVVAVCLHYTCRRDLARLHDEFRVLGTDFRGRYVTRRAMVEQGLVDVLRAGLDEGIFVTEDAVFTARVILGMLSGIVDWYDAAGRESVEAIAAGYARSAALMVCADRA